MPFHFCTEELIAILAMLPFAKVAGGRLRAWLSRHRTRHCCVDGHQHKA